MRTGGRMSEVSNRHDIITERALQHPLACLIVAI
jgi:hypothetical protein